MPSKFVSILASAVVVGLLIVVGGIAGIVYRSLRKKTKAKYDPCATNESIHRSEFSARSQRLTMGAYPEASAAPDSPQT